MNTDGKAGGIALPMEASPMGGFRRAVGDELIEQYVATAVADCDSDNPYQDLGIGQSAVFQIKDDAGWRASVRRRIANMFDAFLEPSNLAKLDRIEFDAEPDDSGEVYMTVHFISIESNERLRVRQPVNRSI